MIFNPVYGENVQPVLQSKTGLSITANGLFSYTPDSGYDGLSEVSGNVNVPSSGGSSWVQQTPVSYDSTVGYPESGSWTPSSSGNIRTDAYQVSVGNVYYFRNTNVVGNRYRVAFFTNNPIVDGSGAGGVNIYTNNTSSPTNFPLLYMPSANGYILINKTANATNNLVIEFYEAAPPA